MYLQSSFLSKSLLGLLTALAALPAFAGGPITIGTTNQNNCVPFSCPNFNATTFTEDQQIFSASAFSGPITINDFEIYAVQYPGNVEGATYKIYFSTTSTAVGTTAQPVTGSDETLFGTFVFPGGQVSGAVTFTGTTPFTYNPADGNLLMTVLISNTIGTFGGASFEADYGDAMSRYTYPNASYYEGLVTTFNGAQAITFGPLPDEVLGGSSPPPLSATASTGMGVTFNSNSTPVCTVSGVTVTLVAAGTCSITATSAFPANPVTRTFTVSPAGIQPVAAFLDQQGAPALTFNGSTSFPDAGGYLIGAPAVTQAPSGDTYVVGLDGAGGVHLNSYSFANTSWNGWQYSGGILDTSSGLTAAVDPGGVVWFTGRDIGNRYWINSWNGTNFGGWICLNGGIFASTSIPQIAIPSDGTIYVIGVDIGGRVWSNSYNPVGQTFTGWVDRQAVMIGQPSVTAGQDGMVYVAVRSVSSDSPVYITQIPSGNSGLVNTWINGGGQIDTDPQITSQDGTVYLMALAGGGTVYLIPFAESNQTYGSWSFTNGTLSDATIAAVAGNVYIAGRDGSDRVYWYSQTGDSWFLAGGAGMSSTVLTGGK